MVVERGEPMFQTRLASLTAHAEEKLAQPAKYNWGLRLIDTFIVIGLLVVFAAA